MKEQRKPIINPEQPICLRKMIERNIPRIPCTIEIIVGVLLNFNAERKITETLSKIIRHVNTK